MGSGWSSMVVDEARGGSNYSRDGPCVPLQPARRVSLDWRAPVDRRVRDLVPRLAHPLRQCACTLLCDGSHVSPSETRDDRLSQTHSRQNHTTPGCFGACRANHCVVYTWPIRSRLPCRVMYPCTSKKVPQEWTECNTVDNNASGASPDPPAGPRDPWTSH
jgi:hypothetical protein